MKKRLLIIIAAIFINSLFCACADKSDKEGSDSKQNSSSISQTSNEDLKGLSEKLCEAMAKDDFDSAYSLFSENLRTQMKESELVSAWDQATAEMGHYKEYHFYSLTEQEDYTIVTSALEYQSNTGLVVSLVYNKAGELDGIWLDHCDFSETGEVILPTKEPFSSQEENQ